MKGSRFASKLKLEINPILKVVQKPMLCSGHRISEGPKLANVSWVPELMFTKGFF